jgi:hypothetical protein
MQRAPTARPTAGNSLVTATILILALAAILTSAFRLISAEYMKSRQWRDETRSFYVAEAGMNEALGTLVASGKDALLALDYPRALGQGTYSVDVVLGEDDPVLMNHRIRLSAHSSLGRTQSGIEVVAWVVPNGKYRYAIFGDDGILLNSNVAVDSYDSMDGAYPGAAPAGFLANVGSNQDIELSSNVGIYGDATPGPSGVVIDTAPAADVYGATSPADEPVVLDPVVVPSIPLSGGPLTVGGNKTVGPGSVHYKAVTVKGGGKLKIVGPATVVIDDLAVLSNANLVIDSASGPVEIYGTGDFELRSNSTITTLGQHAKDLSVFLSGDTDKIPAPIIQLNSNSDFIGTIYAPKADLTLASNFELFGAVMAESVELASNSSLHFDEDLLYEDGVEPEYEQLSWRVLSAQEE